MRVALILALLTISTGCGKATQIDSEAKAAASSTQVSLCGHLFTITSDVYYSQDYSAPYVATAVVVASPDPQNPYYTPPAIGGFGASAAPVSSKSPDPIQLPSGLWQYPQGIYGDSNCHFETI